MVSAKHVLGYVEGKRWRRREKEESTEYWLDDEQKELWERERKELRRINRGIKMTNGNTSNEEMGLGRENGLAGKKEKKKKNKNTLTQNW